MIYSVWDPGRKRYDYFATAEPEDGYPVPRLAARKLGLTPEGAAWALPSGAKPAGHGPDARGMIARPRALGLGQAEGGGYTLTVLGGLGLAAWALWRLSRPRRPRKRRSVELYGGKGRTKTVWL